MVFPSLSVIDYDHWIDDDVAIILFFLLLCSWSEWWFTWVDYADCHGCLTADPYIQYSTSAYESNLVCSLEAAADILLVMFKQSLGTMNGLSRVVKNKMLYKLFTIRKLI